MGDPYGYVFLLLCFSWFMHFVAVNPRTAMEVRKRFSKSNIKRNKKGFLNHFLYLNFHRERRLGIWFHLNFISFVCILVMTALFLLFYFFHFNAIIFVVFFTLGYLFVILLSLVANVKTTEDVFRAKNSSVFSIYLSIILSTIIIVAFSAMGFLYLVYNAVR